MDYRPVPDDRRDDLSAMLSYAFIPEDGPFDPDEELPDPATVGESRGLFEGESLLSVSRHHWFDAHVRGRTLPIGGISGVATPPEHRRRGLIREMLANVLVEYRDTGLPLATLWPFKTPFYEQFGWATAFQMAIQSADPAVFRVGDPPAGRYYRADPGDWRALDAVLRNQWRRRNLAVDRTEEWWRKRTFQGWGTDPYVYVWERGGDPAGYLVYTVEETDDGKELRVSDLAGVDVEARDAMCRLVADHDSQVGSARIAGPPDAVLLDRVDDPADLEVTLDAAAMVRIVDVVAALEGVAYPDGLEGETTVAVADDLAPWNDDTYRFAVAAGEATVEPVDADPAVDLDVGSLSQLLVGYRSLDDLVEFDDARVHADAGGEFLAAALPEARVYVREWF